MDNDICHFQDAKTVVTTSVLRRALDVQRAMSFNGRIYERLYGTHWATAPDCFLMAERDGVAVATAGLVFAANHATTPSESYFDLSAETKNFFSEQRPRIAEIGRLTSTTTGALASVFNAAIDECRRRGIHFLVGWTTSEIKRHLEVTCDFWFDKLDAELNHARALSDKRWTTSPVRFFFRHDAPELLVSTLPLHNARRLLPPITPVTTQSGRSGPGGY